MTPPVRLSKRLVELTSCSRKEAELYIAGGWVMVDGQVVDKPQFMVSQQEKIEFDPEASLVPVTPVTILFHQPPVADIDANAAQQLICADTRATDDPSGIHITKQHFARLKQGIALEKNASGLLIFTQDFRVARKLIDDAATIEQEYIVEIAGKLPPMGSSTSSTGSVLMVGHCLKSRSAGKTKHGCVLPSKGRNPGRSHICAKVSGYSCWP
ncbi:MAG: 23S rRNA pseudouridine2604 synthase [Candidatus Nitrotoga sp. CP45]|nr:MAG: 23S rRNA pseudouridine2604 synthase [Candidatus Nitrotoga sp. CP45]